jgi:hypothetical protein
MFKKYRINLLLGVSSLFGAGLITFSVTACSGVSSTINENLVGKGNGDTFAVHHDLADEVKEALMNKTSSDAFKKAVANKVLYK